MVSYRDRRLLGPVLGRLRLWADTFDAITVESGDEPPLAAEFCDWLRVELALPRPGNRLRSGSERATVA
jgi:hypothetical protein